MATIQRNQILEKVKAVLEPLSYVYAMWEGGAAAFNRVDQWSDIDLQIDVEDEHAGKVLPLVEAALQELAPLDLVYHIPNPPFDIYAQAFFRLRDASPFLLLDVAVIRHSSPVKLLERQVHGEPIVHLDRSGVVKDHPIEPDEWQNRLAARQAELKISFSIFQILTMKELQRGNSIEALAFYFGYTLRPLVELLRIRHAPYRYNFSTRYIHYDLPQELVRRLERLYFIASPEEIAEKRQAAEDWFNELLDG